MNRACVNLGDSLSSMLSSGHGYFLHSSSLRSASQPVFTVPTIRKDVINRMIA